MRTTLCSTFLAVALCAPTAISQNLLANPGFESGSLSGWNSFGNAYPQSVNAPQFVPHGGTTLVSMFGNFTGSFNVSGIFQAFPATPGQTFTMDCWSRHFSGDPLLGIGAPNNNWVVMKIAFFNAGGVEIGAAERTVLDGTSPTDTWIDNTPVSGTAPLGTTSVQALVLYLQPGTAGGACHVDDVVFTGPPSTTYPGSGEDLALATGLGGAAPTSGAGNDVKTASGSQLLEVKVSSPQGTFARMPLWVLGQVFTTGSPRPLPMPGVHFDFGQQVLILVGTIAPPFGGPVIAPGGSSSFFVTPPGMAGFSVMLQGVVFTPAATNGQFAITDGHEIQLR